MKNLFTWGYLLMLVALIVMLLSLAVTALKDEPFYPGFVCGSIIFFLGYTIYGWCEHKRKKEGNDFVRRVMRTDESGGYDIIDSRDKSW